MPNKEALEVLLQGGVEAWNRYIKETNKNVLWPDETVYADLEGANLSERHLENGEFYRSILKDADLRFANLKGANFYKTNLAGANLFGANLDGAYCIEANFENANLSYANIKNANLESANFDRSCVTGIKSNRWARYKGIRASTCFGSQRFKRFAEHQDFIEEFRADWWRFPIYVLWLIISDCGRSLFLWTAWSAIIALGFGLKYHSLGPDAFNLSYLPWSKSAMVYYSVVTFTTLGFGDIAPRNIEAAWWVALEVAIGYVMLGGLISIFATKVVRKN
jgi:uncharacterized protein YjbI with pentapeptide repeats